ncbi:hypothetical protein LWI28_010003 [Acer negundo]|uniref:Uncharacterized protein n=1 Tax=Acer negundo TaxID=4023 RepID=A0AAD5J3R0_ACENE|nr:hypothetical protein LWI28_010003 [Acer negundo]
MNMPTGEASSNHITTLFSVHFFHSSSIKQVTNLNQKFIIPNRQTKLLATCLQLPKVAVFRRQFAAASSLSVGHSVVRISNVLADNLAMLVELCVQPTL